MSTVMPVSSRAALGGPLLALAAVTCVEFLENGVVLFGAGQITAGLALSAQAFALLYMAYGAAAIVMLYQHRWMVERLGYRRFVLASLAVFGLGSLLCATSSGALGLTLGRTLQGMGGSTFFVAGRMLINELPPQARFQGLLTFVCTLLGSTAVAPLLAAGLHALGGWRALFGFGVVLAIGVAVVAPAHLPTERPPHDERSHEHWGWLLWVVVGVCGLQYVVQTLPLHALDDPLGWAAIGLVSVLMLTLFAWRQWGRERPLINYRGLLQPRYLTGLALYFVGYFWAGALGFLLPWMLTQELGLPVMHTAWLTSLCLLCSVAMALGHIFLARVWPCNRAYMLGGLLLLALGSLLLSRVGGPQVIGLPLLGGIVLCGLAIPLFVGPVAMNTFSELAAPVFSHGYQVKNIVRQLGLSFSVALATLLLQHLAHAGPQALWLLQAWTPAGTPAAQAFALLALLTLPVAAGVALQRVFR